MPSPKPSVLLVALLVGVAGCKPDQAGGPKPQVAVAPAGGNAAAGDGGVAPRHAGTLVAAPFGHAELALKEGGALSLYLYGPGGEPLAVVGTSASVRAALPGFKERPLQTQGDALVASIPELAKGAPTLVVVLKGPMGAAVLRFSPAEEGGGHASTGRKMRDPVLDELAAFVTDSTCLLRGEGTAKGHRDCAVRCIQGGAAIALVEKGTNEIFVAVAPPGQSVKDMLLPYVGGNALVRGKRRSQGGSQFFDVKEVYAAHDHASFEGGAVGMAGDLHLEVLATRDGEVRVYLSDDFRRPVDPSAVGGVAELRDGVGEIQTAPLRVDANKRYLFAKTGAFQSNDVELSARLKLGPLGKRYGVPNAENEDFMMTFLVEPLDPDGARAKPALTAAATETASSEVNIEVKGGYSPSEIRLKKGVPAKLRFHRKDSGECSRELLIPEFEVNQELAALKETVIEVTPKRSGEFEFTCGMHMMKGKIVVD